MAIANHWLINELGSPKRSSSRALVQAITILLHHANIEGVLQLAWSIFNLKPHDSHTQKDAAELLVWRSLHCLLTAARH